MPTDFLRRKFAKKIVIKIQKNLSKKVFLQEKIPKKFVKKSDSFFLDLLDFAYFASYPKIYILFFFFCFFYLPFSIIFASYRKSDGA